MTGHFFKIASFYLVYRSIIVTGLERPQELLFSRLGQSEQSLRKANTTQNTIISILSHDLSGRGPRVASWNNIPSRCRFPGSRSG